MAAFLISYDLHKKGEADYENLITTIKSFPNWCHHLESDWVVISASTAVAIRDKLLPHVHKDDKLIVFDLGKDAAWSAGFPSEVSNWLKTNL